PAATGMAEGLGVSLDIVDVGWPSSAAIAFGSSIGAMIIPLGLVVNMVLLVTGLTRTFDIDLWNYWHSAMIGALVGAVTGNYLLGLLSAAVHLALILAIGDLTAPIVQKYFQLPEISFPHGTSAPYGLLAIPLNRVFDAIPGLRSLDATPEAIQKRFGLFGETLMMGLILGLLIGLLGYGFDAPAEDSTAILTLAISLAAAMFLLPADGVDPDGGAAADLRGRPHLRAEAVPGPLLLHRPGLGRRRRPAVGHRDLAAAGADHAADRGGARPRRQPRAAAGGPRHHPLHRRRDGPDLPWEHRALGDRRRRPDRRRPVHRHLDRPHLHAGRGGLG